MRQICFAFAIIATSGATGCLPHPSVPQPAWFASPSGEGEITAIGLVPRTDTEPARVGVFAEGVVPTVRHPTGEERSAWVVRAGVLPSIWLSGLPLPTADVRWGYRVLLVRSERIAWSVEFGGMPTVFFGGLLALGAVGYGATHATLKIGALELFASLDAAGGLNADFTFGPQTTATGSSLNAGAGVSIRASSCRIALVGGVTRTAQSLELSGTPPIDALLFAPFVGLQLSLDSPKR